MSTPTGATAAPPTWRAVEQIMGMPVSVALRGRHAGDTGARDAWAAVVAELREVDRVFSTYRDDSVVSRLGRGELTLAECPPEMAEVLALGERAERDSGGAFAVRRPGADGSERFDPSGVVKGWAIERAARHLHALADTDSCLSGGGDLVCRVAGPDSPDWSIGIEHPDDPTRLVGRVPMRDGAVATSGLAHRGAHIVDARTGRTPQLVAAVTVVARSLVDADLDATSAFALDEDAARWLAGRTDRTGLVVWRDGRVETVVGRVA
ncbi:FAD:protein FMN transferase [Nocardioides fonticola]|uniref:FAD:protein FMN transferase n=1 Tax=Nocardioides fonticola TaxID=450363 RepID=A0ABP7XSA3_9ACTN